MNEFNNLNESKKAEKYYANTIYWLKIKKNNKNLKWKITNRVRERNLYEYMCIGGVSCDC